MTKIQSVKNIEKKNKTKNEPMFVLFFLKRSCVKRKTRNKEILLDGFREKERKIPNKKAELEERETNAKQVKRLRR